MRITLTKAEVAAIRWLDDTAPVVSPCGKARDSLLAKLLLAESPPKKITGISVDAAVKAMESVLGTGTVALPPHANNTWFMRMSVLIRTGSLVEADFIAAAGVLNSRGWSPPFSFERTVWSIDRLLAEAKDGKKRWYGDFRQAPLGINEP